MYVYMYIYIYIYMYKVIEQVEQVRGLEPELVGAFASDTLKKINCLVTSMS
jgi:hypothetical protein